jgi:hypothetical protein
VIRANLVLQKMTLMMVADLREQSRQLFRLTGFLEPRIAPAGTKTQVVVELISPLEACERFKVHCKE